MKISRFFSKQTAALLAAICLVGAFHVVASAQTWNGIMLSGEAVEYYQYTNGTRTEVSVENSSLSQLRVTSRPAFTYAFSLIPGPNGTQRSVCQIVNQTDPSHPAYWYSDGTASATSTAGSYPSAPPSQFHESRNLTGVKGLEFLGTFTAGTVSGGTSAGEVVYFTDRHCSDGGREFGFFKDLASADRIVFYSSDFANCTPYCRKTASPAVDQNLQPQVNGGSVAITNLASGAHYFRAYMTSDTNFHVQVLETDHATLSQCSFDGGMTTGSCQTDVSIPSSFLFSSTSGLPGYVVSGIQSVGFSHVPNDPTFYVQAVNVRQ